jgi:hypothetical protein
VHVHQSIALYRASLTAATPADAQTESDEATAQLRLALPLAATAAGESAQWQAFMITLTESSRVPEANLVSALQQQCADAQGGGQPTLPPTSTAPTTTPTLPEPVGR